MVDRRTFIKSALFGGIGLGVGLPLLRPKPIIAAPFPTYDKRVLVNMTLEGGPDFRFLFVPPFNDDKESFGFKYWAARSTAHKMSPTPSAAKERFGEYLRTEWNGTVFGIHPNAGWLKAYFDAGKVAIVNNVLHSRTRNHAHSLLVLQAGDYGTGPHDLARDGWGGRLATTIKGNVVSMTRNQLMFCNGPHPTNPKDHDNSMVISANNTRNFALFHEPKLREDPATTGTSAVLSRALRSYYQAKRNLVPQKSPYYKFMQHEQVLRQLGDSINERLDAISEPETIKRLYESGEYQLEHAHFGRQIRNMYDAFATADILNFRVGSLDLGGWDSHKRQKDTLEPKFKDMFGVDQGFATFFKEMKATMPVSHDNMVFVIAGEFGRQLTSNGDDGTDHGRGNSMLIFGEQVKGGLYGEMFPQSEIERYAKPNTDIEGKTSFEHVFGRLADWVEPGTGTTIFPGRTDAIKEDGVDLSNLLTSA